MSGKEHPVWEEELMPYVDGQLDAKQASAIADHLKACPECSAAVEAASGLSQQMKAWAIEDASEKMTAEVLNELKLQRGARQTPGPRVWWTRGRVWAYGLSGAVAALFLLFVVATPSLLRSRQAADDNLAVAVAPPPLQVPKEGFQHEIASQAGEGQAGQAGPQLRAALQTEQGPSDVAGPMVIRNAMLTIMTKEFDTARSRIETIVRQSQGYLDQLTVRGEAGSGRTLSASLRLPSDRMDSGLIELRKLGKVREESQNSSDVTSQYVDLQARLTNARNTEQRLVTLLKERTGKLTDVVSVEREISRVREEIERMEARRKSMANQVQFATIQVEVTEEYRAALEPSVPSAGTQLRNALIAGYHGVLESLLGLALFTLRYGPSLLLWAAVLLPVGLVLKRRIRRARPGRA